MSKVNKSSKNTLIYIILGLLVLGLLGYFLVANKSISMPGATSNKVKIAASFYPLYFFASEIGKDKAEVFSVTPNGIEPHEYEPTAQDIAKVQDSKMLLINGAGFEPWADKMQADLQANNIQIVNTTEGLELQSGEAHGHEGEEHATEEAGHEEEALDPHVWLSPVLAKEQVARITAAYVQADPENKTYYETNAATLMERLDKLHAKYQAGLQTCELREFVTAHAAFGYIANTYNLEELSITGLSPEEEPSSAKLAEVTDFVNEHGVQYIFFESLVDPKYSETIATETGAKTLVLDPIEGISDDNKKQNKNYFTVMEDNLKNLQIALQCTQ